MANKHIPCLALNMHDLSTVESIVTAYLAYLRRSVSSYPTDRQHGQMRILQGVQVRLKAAGMSNGQADVQLLLSLDELSALRDAVRGFIKLIRRMIAPSQNRDETIEELERLCRDLQHMLASQAR